MNEQMTERMREWKVTQMALSVIITDWFYRGAGLQVT